MSEHHNLTGAEKQLVERILQQHPDLTWPEAVEALKEAGMITTAPVLP